MTIFRSAGETRRRIETAEVEGSKWRQRHDNPFGPTNFLMLGALVRVVSFKHDRLLSYILLQYRRDIL